MKRIFILFFILINLKAVAQEIAIYDPSKDTVRIFTEIAMDVFKTNKYLDFKGYDSLKLYKDGIHFKTINLKKYFDRPKNWTRIESESIKDYYKHKDGFYERNYTYTETDSTLTETFDYFGVMEHVIKKKTVYNKDLFIIYEESQWFDKNLNLTETNKTYNYFLSNNQLYKIVKYNELPVEEESKRFASNDLYMMYDKNIVHIQGNFGRIKAEFLPAKKSIK